MTKDQKIQYVRDSDSKLLIVICKTFHTVVCWKLHYLNVIELYIENLLGRKRSKRPLGWTDERGNDRSMNRWNYGVIEDVSYRDTWSLKILSQYAHKFIDPF